MPVISTRITKEQEAFLLALAQLHGQKKAGVMLDALLAYMRVAATGKEPVWLDVDAGPPSVNLNGTYSVEQLQDIVAALAALKNDKTE